MSVRVRCRLAGVCLAGLLAAPSLAQDRVPIPVRALFENPRISSPAVSPNGDRIAFLLSQGDLQIVAARGLSGGVVEGIGQMDDPRVRFSWLGWAKNDVLWVTNDRRNPFAIGTKARAAQLFSASFTERKVRWLGFMPPIVHWLPDDPEVVLLDDWGRVRRMRARDGKILTRLVQGRAKSVEIWHADATAQIRAGEALVVNEVVLWARRAPEADFARVASFDVLEDQGTSFAGFHADPGKIYVRAPHDGRTALFAADIDSGELGAPVFAHPEVDAGNLITDPNTNRVLGWSYIDDRPRVEIFDPVEKAAREAVSAELEQRRGPGISHFVTSVDRSGRYATIEASSDAMAPAYYLHDRKTNALERISEAESLAAWALARSERVTYQARDGLAIPAYLTLPPGAERKRLPTIVLPHGGPSARDWIGWNPELQLFASRGYAVFQMNFRGSNGYGRAFEQAGHREWGGKMQDDITDGVKWLIAEGIADPDRIGIYGTSYGGYAALMGLIRTPELFRAGATYAGVTDLPSMIAEDRWYGRFTVAANRKTVGGGWSDRERLRFLSPRRRASEISAPLLIGHGEQDDRVNVGHSRDMARELRAVGKPFEYLEFEHEIHGFALEANRIRWYEALIAFFEKNLAARANAAAEPAAN